MDSCHLPAKQQRILLMLSNNEQFMCHCLAQTTKAVPRLRHPYCRRALESASVDVVTACTYAHATFIEAAQQGLELAYTSFAQLHVCLLACRLNLTEGREPNSCPDAQRLVMLAVLYSCVLISDTMQTAAWCLISVLAERSTR